jgi:hypothetical protein
LLSRQVSKAFAITIKELDLVEELNSTHLFPT